MTSSTLNNFSCKLHSLQKKVYQDKHRFRVVVAGRRWGKTKLSSTEIIVASAEKSDQLIWYIAPTYQMARDLMWDSLKRIIPYQWIKKTNETRMSMEFVNGSRIVLKGADKPDTLRGVGLNLVVLDEAQDMKEETWQEVIQPTLATTRGRAIFIGTPKSFNWLYDLYQLGQRPDHITDSRGKIIENEWKSWQFPTSSSPFVPRSEIEARRHDMDPKSFAQEFEASFVNMSGRVYYAFDRTKHVGEYKFNPTLPIYIGMDFNIDPMSSIVLQEQPDGEIWVVDEAILFGSNVQETADELSRRYYRYLNQISIYPDPAGNNRNHDRGETSLDILREAGFKNIYFKRKHPAVQDRVNSVNRLLFTANGEIRLRVDANCSGIINSLEQTTYKEGSREVDKAKGVEHAADALGYYVDFRHPMRQPNIIGISL